MINTKTFISSMKFFLGRQLIFTNRRLSQFISNFTQNKFTSCGKKYMNLLLKSLKNNFWIDVFKERVDLHNTCVESGVTADLTLLLNPMIHIGGKSFLINNYLKIIFDTSMIHVSLKKMLFFLVLISFVICILM